MVKTHADFVKTGAVSRNMVLMVCAFVRLGRPLFLVGGFVLYGLGASLALLEGHALSGLTYALGQAAVTSFQLMTHYSNDYFDYETDLANRTPTRFSGGSRVLQEGLLPRATALVAALVCAGLGIGLTFALVLWGGHVTLTLSLFSAIGLLSWTYSAPPLRLHSRGLGELVVVLVVTILVPGAGYLLQAPDAGGLSRLLLAIVPLCCLQFAMLLAIELPDARSDSATGKRTLVVRIGVRRAGKVYAAVTLAAYASLPLLYGLGLPPEVALAALLPAPLAVWRVLDVYPNGAPSSKQWEALTFWAVLLFAVTATSEVLGVWRALSGSTGAD